MKMVSFKVLHIVTLLFTVLVAYGQEVKSFRPDYKYLESAKSFYKFHDKYVTWYKANSTCAEEGTSLFVPENEKEATDLPFFIDQRSVYLWLGITDFRQNNVYETNDGRPINEVYNKWSISHSIVDHCVIIRSDSTLRTYDCNDVWRFVCKYKPTKTEQ